MSEERECLIAPEDWRIFEAMRDAAAKFLATGGTLYAFRVSPEVYADICVALLRAGAAIQDLENVRVMYAGVVPDASLSGRAIIPVRAPSSRGTSSKMKKEDRPGVRIREEDGKVLIAVHVEGDEIGIFFEPADAERIGLSILQVASKLRRETAN